ncbi:MAG: hypothetical protein NT135_02985 [Candidatus Berkelbacteria bacterium]|nr:hypothetical protein [Candidatus Berkelbacteria bacterium]
MALRIIDNDHIPNRYRGELFMQSRMLMKENVPEKVGDDSSSYSDKLIQVAESYVWRNDLAYAGYTSLMLVDSRLQPKDLRSLIRIDEFQKPLDDCRNLSHRSETDSGIYIIQFQPGLSLVDRSTSWFRTHKKKETRGFTTIEGYLLWYYNQQLEYLRTNTTLLTDSTCSDRVPAIHLVTLELAAIELQFPTEQYHGINCGIPTCGIVDPYAVIR